MTVCGRAIGSAVLAAALGIAPCAMAQAQYRDHQEPVLTPPPTAPAPAPPDVVAPFRSAYQAAGAPRIMLFWNVAFDDQTQTQYQRVELETRSNNQHSNGLDKQTQGPDGDATLNQGDTQSQEVTEHTTTDKIIDPAKQTSPLGPRDATDLEVAFRRALESAGVSVVSRATGMRMTQVDRDRAGADPKLIEADAVARRADLLLEVVMVPDADAPLGAGFKVTLTEVRSGTEVFTRYTAARVPTPPPVTRTVVTDTGFERRTMPPPPASVADVGVELAHEVMEILSQHLVPQSARGR
jgi:hypothetical protein